MLIVPPSPIDMASLIGCKNWIGTLASGQNGSDANIQACITAASMYFVRETGRGPRNWQNFTQNPFNQPVDYSETYDGTAGLRLFLRNFPINTVASVNIAGVAVQTSASPQSPGWVIDNQGRALVMRAGGGGASPQTFAYVNLWGNGFTAGATPLQGWRPWGVGPQQIAVSYNAGFNTVPIVNAINAVIPAWSAGLTVTPGQQVSNGVYLQTAVNGGTTGSTAPAWGAFTGSPVITGDNGVQWQNNGIQAPPNTILIQTDVAILSDQGVKYFVGGAALTQVFSAPTAAGQYFLVAPGQYLFNVADAGAQMMVSYTQAGTPPDAVLAIFQLVALNYVRRNWIGLRQEVMKDVGSTTYTLDIDPTIVRVISNYKRANFAN